MQLDENKRLRPVCYLSKKLSPTERRYTVTARELLAIFTAFAAWRPYLENGKRHLVYCDHRPLAWLKSNSSTLVMKFAHYLETLARVDLEVVHRPGKEMGPADGLSRREDWEDGWSEGAKGFKLAFEDKDGGPDLGNVPVEEAPYSLLRDDGGSRNPGAVAELDEIVAAEFGSEVEAAQTLMEEAGPGTQDWMFDREEAELIEHACGTFDADGATDASGSNALFAPFASHDEPFQKKDLRDRHIWLNGRSASCAS